MKKDVSSRLEQSPVSNNRTSLRAVQHEASVDTIKLSSSEFDVSSSSDIQILPHLVNLNGETEERTALFQDSAGREHYGQKAFINEDNYNVTIKNGYLFIQLNANKLSHPYELQTDREKREAEIRSVTNAIKESGIECDFDEMNVSRLDLCKQKQMEHSLMTYHSVFSALSAKRQISRVHGDTFLFMNKSRGTQFYDKSIEAEIPNMKNLIRGELQLKNGKTVQRHTPIKTLSHLLQTDTEEITDIYNRQLRDTLFSGTTEPDVASEIEILRSLQRAYPRYFVDRYLQLVGIPELIRKYKSVDAFCDVLENFGLDRTTIYRRKKKLSQHFKEYTLLREQAEEQSKRLFAHIYSFAA